MPYDLTHTRLTQMQTSKVIEADGVFIGVAVLLADSKGWRFVAAHPRAQDADGATAATLQEAQMLAKRAYITGRPLVIAPLQ